MGLLTQPGVTGPDKYCYEDIAGAVKCVVSAHDSRANALERQEMEEKKNIRVTCNLFVGLEGGGGGKKKKKN